MAMNGDFLLKSFTAEVTNRENFAPVLFLPSALRANLKLGYLNYI